jgi:DNA excision repair protein ERCC-2
MGTRWHQVLAEEQRQLIGDGLQLEVPIEGSLRFEGWQFLLTGRIDQVIRHPEELLLREVKTVRELIPWPVAKLEEHYASYFEQLACYQLLWSIRSESAGDPTPVAAELLFIHPETGIRQSVRLRGDPEKRLELRLKRWVEYLEGRLQASLQLQSWEVPQPFENLRDEQIPVRDVLARSRRNPGSSAGYRFLCLEAPTGFGKTSLALEWALRGLQQSHYDRVLYLTGKTTGQIPVLNELRRFQSRLAGLRFFQIRNLEAHLDLCPHAHCACAKPERERTSLAPWIPLPSVIHLLEQGSPRVDLLAATASLHQICPRLLTTACLGQAEVWVGDYNYAFAFRASGLMDAIPGFDPARCLLIVDEVHNLHERIASNHSGSITAGSLGALAGELRDHRGSRSLVSILDRLKKLCSDQNPCQRLDERTAYSVRDHFQSFQEAIQNGAGVGADLSENALTILWRLADLGSLLAQDEIRELLFWVPETGKIAITCLDASPVIHRVLQSYHQVLLMSATLPPVDTLALQTRLGPPDLCWIRTESPWRKDAYEVAVDCRVDTRYQKREQYYRTTASTLEQLIHHSEGPVLAFFPSYQYAETIARYLEVQSPHLRCATVPRDISGEAHSEFLDHALLSQDAILLPLGGGLSEGIDSLGGRIGTIMVVSPALPEVNALQNARSCRFTDAGEAFREVYLIPGMTKVNQALGRIVRAPEHRARVLLHCKRFAQEPYLSLLSPEYRNPTLIRSGSELETWLMLPQEPLSGD